MDNGFIVSNCFCYYWDYRSYRLSIAKIKYAVEGEIKMIRLQEVKTEERELLWNINQKYQYEMTRYYPDKMDDLGNYHHKYFDAYFTDEKRKAFLIYDDEILVGFVMLNPYSAIDHHPDYTIAEFTIFPSYRRKHYAIDAVHLLLSNYHGKWEIKYNEKNTGAKKLWTTITAPYFPVIYHINEEETVIEFTNNVE